MLPQSIPSIAELLAGLTNVDQTLSVCFEFANCRPTSLGSWRGAYDQPALGWQPSGYSKREQKLDEFPTVAQFCQSLRDDMDRHHGAWHGGTASFREDQKLHVDNDGDATNTVITGFSALGTRLVLHTAYVPYQDRDFPSGGYESDE